MESKVVTELNEHDIRKIIAKCYNVSCDKVRLYTRAYTDGYGLSERTKYEVCMRIESWLNKKY